MRIRLLDPIGAEVTELPLTDVDAEAVTRLRQLLAERGVLVLPGQDADDAAFLTFLRAFGRLAFTAGEPPLAGFADLNEVSNVGRTTPPRSQFHVDTSYVRLPPAYTALRAVLIPQRGGETVFSDQYRAYDTLPDDVRQRLWGRTIRHVATGLQLGEDDEASAEHPVFRPHPVSGRTALYISTPQRCAAISGLDATEAQATIAYLIAHSTQEDNLYRHRWSPGDVVMWDNSCVLHRADHHDVAGDRVMHRGMIAEYAA
jgi:taurine dioxygenase